MRVLVTRPAAQAATWVRLLAARGIDAAALPLIDIVPPADTQAVAAAWRALPARRLAVFVSPNAAEQFFIHRPPDMAWPAQVQAASIGPGTTQALFALGVTAGQLVEPDADAAQFDSEALWQRLRTQSWRDASVLVVRGDGGREWLADTLRAQGARVDFVSAYRRVAPRFDDDAVLRTRLDAALADGHEHLWLFSSSEAIEHLLQARPRARWHEARAIATHPRIAQRARDAGFASVHETRPTLEAVVACIQSLAS
ncbi:MAG TPA: uroporphyrinogen-III synthase [Albitalea sp.]|uniref:uroporphyrinogen-III synthase n=1 Tax=Piscinibacter sp. TaxID=1903157 RepID=UPI002ED517D5